MQENLKEEKNKQKWIGLMFHEKHERKIQNNKFNLVMHRASVLNPELAKHGYRLICYSPTNVNKEDKTITGYRYYSQNIVSKDAFGKHT